MFAFYPLSPSTRGTCLANGTAGKPDGDQTVINNEKHTMHLLFSPVLGNALYIGGGSVGLLLVILIVVLLLRR
jgi:hypothetical protein